MKMLFYILALVTILGGAALAADESPDTVTSAPGITVETSVDRSEIYIGDLISYRLTIVHDSNIVLTPPPIGANLGAFDVKDYQTDESTKLKDGRIKIESRFMLTTFTTGDYVIPPIPVKFMLPDSTVKYLISEPIPIRVKSLLAESADSTSIRDIKGPIEFKTSKAIYYYLGGAAALILAIGGYLYWRAKKRRTLVGEPVDLRKPWEIAFEALALLKEKNYLIEGKFKLFYIELTETVRAYLGRIYGIPVLDMTTEEFLSCIAKGDVTEEFYERLRLFLNYADLVKFAKLVPEEGKTAIDFDEAAAIVEFVRVAEMARAAEPGIERTESVRETGV